MPRYRVAVSHNGLRPEQIVELHAAEVPMWEYEIAKGYLVAIPEPPSEDVEGGEPSDAIVFHGVPERVDQEPEGGPAPELPAA